MSIRLGIYDFFAYTVPGGLYILLLVYSLQEFQFIAIDFRSVDLSLMQIIIYAVLAYVVGLVADPIVNKSWYRLFKREGLHKSALRELKDRYPDLEFNFTSKYWPVLLAYMKKEDIDTAVEMERHNVTNIMLRNVSFIFLVLSLIQFIQFGSQGFPVWRMVLGIVFLTFSIVAVQQSLKFGRWFFLSIFEGMVARSLDFSDLVVERQMSESQDATQAVQRPIMPIATVCTIGLAIPVLLWWRGRQNRELQ